MSGPDFTGDPFGVLGVEPRFDVRPELVERSWLKLAGELHPDRVADSDEAVAKLARINEARAVLLDAEQRANALLTRLGGPSKETDRSLPDGFLAEMMEVRESAEEARTSGDQAAWDAFRTWADARRRAHVESVGSLFARYGEASDDRILKSIRMELNAWRYIERMLEQLDDSRGVM